MSTSYKSSKKPEASKPLVHTDEPEKAETVIEADLPPAPASVPITPPAPVEPPKEPPKAATPPPKPVTPAKPWEALFMTEGAWRKQQRRDALNSGKVKK